MPTRAKFTALMPVLPQLGLTAQVNFMLAAIGDYVSVKFPPFWSDSRERPARAARRTF